MFKPSLNTSGAIVVRTEHRFADTSARDTYFASHADELVNLLYIWIEDTSTLQQYYTSTASFISVHPVVGIKGDDGADGTDGHSITVSVQASEPATKAVGDIWVDTDDSLFNTADDSVLWNGIARPTLAGNANKALAVNSAGNAFEFATVAIDGTYASKTESDLTLYVYEDATGTGDGSSKANGFTSLQAAIDAIPDVAQNVTIIVCKGSTNYLGQTTTIQKASVKSLTIQGEFYAYEACDANAVAGKVVDADADFSDFAVGDRVVCTKYSGTVGSSAIVDYFYATITEVGEGYVQTSEETKVPTTGWKYLINQTVFDGNNGWDIVIHNLTPDLLTQTLGLSIINVNARAITTRPYVNKCIIYDTYGISANPEQGLIYDSAVFVPSGSTGGAITLGPGALSVSRSVFAAISGTVTGIAEYDFGRIICYYSGFFGLYKALDSRSSTCNIHCAACYIDSSCTYGAYGYNITLDNCTNNAATPVYHLTSGGRVADVDIHGATPETAIADDDEILIYDASASANRKMTRSNFLSGVPGYVDDIIGVKWDSSSSSPTLTRVDEDLQEISAGYINWPKYFDRHPIWGQMWRCNLTADGDATFGTNARGDGLTLTNDYTMVRIPRVYHRFVYDDGDWYWLVSPEPSSGFDLHPAFYQRGHSAAPADQIYVGAYTAGANGGTTTTNGTSNCLTATDWTGLKLTSKSGAKNLTGSGTSGTMAQFESAGNAIGTGWGLTNFHTLNLLQLLFYIEFASFDSQSKLGLGRTNTSNTAAAITGTYLNQVGEGAGTDIQSLLATNGTYGSTTTDYHSVVWRGIENLWGNIWQFIPGYNTTDTSHRILKRDGTGTIADVLTAGNYDEITSPIPLNGVDNISGTDVGTFCHGYVSAFDRDTGNILGSMFIPGALAGASNTYLTDYFYTHQSGVSQTGVLLAGGHWNNGAMAGVGGRGSDNRSSNVDAKFGGRLEAIL